MLPRRRFFTSNTPLSLDNFFRPRHVTLDNYLINAGAYVKKSVEVTPLGHRVYSFEVLSSRTHRPVRLSRDLYAQLLYTYGRGHRINVFFDGERAGEFRAMSAVRSLAANTFDTTPSALAAYDTVQAQLNRIENRIDADIGYGGPTVDGQDMPTTLNTSMFSYVGAPRLGSRDTVVGLNGVQGAPTLLKLADYPQLPGESCWAAAARHLKLPVENHPPTESMTLEEGIAWMQSMVMRKYNECIEASRVKVVVLDANAVFQERNVPYNTWVDRVLLSSAYHTPLVRYRSILRPVIPEMVGMWDEMYTILLAGSGAHVHAVETTQVASDKISPKVNPVGFVDVHMRLWVMSDKKDPRKMPEYTLRNVRLLDFTKMLLPYELRTGVRPWQMFINTPKGMVFAKVGDQNIAADTHAFPGVLVNQPSPSTTPISNVTRMMLTEGNTLDKSDDEDIAYLFYDVETVVDVHLKVYSVGFCLITQAELDNPNTDEHAWKPRVRMAIGPHAIREFVSYIGAVMRRQQYRKLIVTGFNSARFDNYFLLEGFNTVFITKVDNVHIRNVFFSGNALLFAEADAWKRGEKVRTELALLDVAKLLPAASLASLGKNFRTTFQKVEGFNHDDVQNMFAARGWAFCDDPEFSAKLTEYNVNDVLVLACLLRTYRATLRELIPDSFKKWTNKFPATLGGLTFAHWQNEVAELIPTVLDDVTLASTQDNIIDRLQPDDYVDIRMGTIGGRCSLIHGPISVESPTAVLDAASLYPTVMAVWDQAWYPAGAAFPVTDFDPNRLGVYKCDIDQSALAGKGLINLVARKEFMRNGAPYRNSWDEDFVCGVWLTTPELVLCREAGVDVNIRRGLVWSHKVRGCDLFRCLLVFMKEKKKQDQLKAEGKPHNPALRQLCKYLMNSLYGQMLKRLYTVSSFSVSPWQLARYEKDLEEGKLLSIKNVAKKAGEVFITVGKHLDSVIHKQSPFILGAYVLGLSRTYMARYLWLRIPRSMLYYIDTDCAHIHKTALTDMYRKHATERVSVFPEVLEFDPDYARAYLYCANPYSENNQHLNVVGCFTDDTPGDAHGIHFAGKKLYAFRRIDGSSSQDDGGHGIAVKGVGKKDIFLSNEEAAFLLSKTGEAREEAARFVYLQAGESRTLASNGVPFLLQLMRDDVAYVLCRQLRVVSNDVHPSRAEEFGSIKDVFTVKRISKDGVAPVPENLYIPGPDYPAREELLRMFNRTYTVDEDAPDADVGHDVLETGEFVIDTV